MKPYFCSNANKYNKEMNKQTNVKNRINMNRILHEQNQLHDKLH